MIRIHARHHHFVVASALIVLPVMHILAFVAADAQAQCPPNPPPPPAGGLANAVEGVLPEHTIEFGDATIGMDACGRFLTAWAAGPTDDPDDDLWRILIQRFQPDGALDGGVQNITALNPLWIQLQQTHCMPSVAVSPGGHVRIAWVAQCADCQPEGGPQIVETDFDSCLDTWGRGRIDEGEARATWGFGVGELAQ